tara:strand:+ start:366 stop:929 length:564 start_codon:yes stop_codon:yes gene_type:complete
MTIKNTNIVINKDDKNYSVLSKVEYNALRTCIRRKLPRSLVNKKIDKETVELIYQNTIKDKSYYDDYSFLDKEEIETVKGMDKELIISYLLNNTSLKNKLTIYKKCIEEEYYDCSDEDLEGLDMTDENAVDDFCYNKSEDYNIDFESNDYEKNYDRYELIAELVCNLPHENQITDFNYNVEEEKKSA